MVIGLYVGFATVGVFAFWFIYYNSFVAWVGPDMMASLGSPVPAGCGNPDCHSMVSWEQLTNWDTCEAGRQGKGAHPELWTAEATNWADFDFNGDGILDIDGKATGKFETLKDDPCKFFTEGKVKASTLSLSVLVTIEMFNALNAISEDGSLVTMPPWVNPWLLIAMTSSFALHFLLLCDRPK
eukprot:SAG31_NODE_8262_length_1486_cov_1.541456_2_plen_183_part_00